jgi:hypothetical protein
MDFVIYPPPVIAAAIHDVNVVRDGWDWVVVAAGIAGAFGAVIAIGFAVAAQRASADTRRDAVGERWRQFELTVLRELVRDLDESPHIYIEAPFQPAALRRYRLRLDLIDGDLPYWRRLVHLDWHDEVVEASGLSDLKARQRSLSRQIFEHSRPPNAGGREWEEKHARLAGEVAAVAEQIDAYVTDRLTRELHEAIVARVESGREVRLRRTWRPSTWRRRFAE